LAVRLDYLDKQAVGRWSTKGANILLIYSLAGRIGMDCVDKRITPPRLSAPALVDSDFTIGLFPTLSDNDLQAFKQVFEKQLPRR